MSLDTEIIFINNIGESAKTISVNNCETCLLAELIYEKNVLVSL